MRAAPDGAAGARWAREHRVPRSRAFPQVKQRTGMIIAARFAPPWRRAAATAAGSACLKRRPARSATPDDRWRRASLPPAPIGRRRRGAERRARLLEA
jgi:hypothetical protein